MTKTQIEAMTNKELRAIYDEYLIHESLRIASLYGTSTMYVYAEGGVIKREPGP